MLTLKDKAIKILLIGYSDSGKTYFLGSLGGLTKPDLFVKHNFSVLDRSFHNAVVQNTYNTICGLTKGVIGSTYGSQDIELIFKSGGEDLFDLKITDIEGQAVMPNQKIPESEKLRDRILDFDGIIMLLKAPDNSDSYHEKQNQLNDLISFINTLLNNRAIPIALLFTQIDDHTRLRDNIKTLIKRRTASYSDFLNNIQDVDKEKKFLNENPHFFKNEELEQLKRTIKNSANSKNNELIEEFLKTYKAEQWKMHISQILKKNVDNEDGIAYIPSLIEMFKKNTMIPSHLDNIRLRNVFLTSVFGFENSKDNPNDPFENNKDKPNDIEDKERKTKISKNKGNIKPYGCYAAFLWIIYKIIQLNKSNETIFDYNLSSLFNEDLIVETIEQLYTDGYAFYDENSNYDELLGRFNL